VTSNSQPTPRRRRLTVHGRVAWVYQPPDGGGGMGIEFLGLSELDAAVLRELAGPPREEVRQLDVWFDGVEQPVRVEALSADGEVKLRTSLPFLKLGANLSFGANDLGTLGSQGRLDDVDLIFDPARHVPVLELRVRPNDSQQQHESRERTVGPIIPGKTAHDTLRTLAGSVEAAKPDVADTRLALEAGAPVDAQRSEANDRLDHVYPEQVESREAGSMADSRARTLDELREPAQELLDGTDEDEDRAELEAAEPDARTQLELDLAREKMASSMHEAVDLSSERGLHDSAANAATDEAEGPRSAYDSEDPGREVAEDGRRPLRGLRLAVLAALALGLAWAIHGGLWSGFGPEEEPEASAAAAQQTPAEGLTPLERGRPRRRCRGRARGERTTGFDWSAARACAHRAVDDVYGARGGGAVGCANWRPRSSAASAFWGGGGVDRADPRLDRGCEAL
jgi:hypothetical protein